MRNPFRLHVLHSDWDWDWDSDYDSGWESDYDSNLDWHWRHHTPLWSPRPETFSDAPAVVLYVSAEKKMDQQRRIWHFHRHAAASIPSQGAEPNPKKVMTNNIEALS